MNDSAIRSLEVRIARVERSNRRLLALLTASLVLVVGMGFRRSPLEDAAQAATKKPSGTTLRAPFRVIDRAGKTIFQVTTAYESIEGDYYTELQLSGPTKGAGEAYLWVGDFGSHLSLDAPKDLASIDLCAHGNVLPDYPGGYLRISGPNGREYVHLGSTETLSGLLQLPGGTWRELPRLQRRVDWMVVLEDRSLV